MTDIQWLLEGALALLLVATLVHAIRLEKALGTLRRDRSALERLITGFNDSTRQAESGIERLRAASEGAGRQIARHIDQAKSLKDDLIFLADRAEQAADRMEKLIRDGRASELVVAAPMPAATPARAPTLGAAVATDERERVRSQAERELLRALKLAR